ncbi:MAG: hypothetical protein GPJ54_21325 [Candidatus Heimdallarchaeota archaeon]|nr:hypothetical protein [Candidatus Heimdallarchaeota archaeon]
MADATTFKSNNESTLRNIKFPELPLFIISALIFLDIGILLGSLNSLRFGGEEIGIGWIDDMANQPEIHQTHWTSTLLGGVSIIMLGQIYFFFAQVSEKKNAGHFLTLPVLVLWLIGVAGSYLIAWNDVDKGIFIFSMKLSIALFLLSILMFFLDDSFRSNIKNHPPLLLLLSALIWLAIAMFWRFDIDLGSLDRVFLTTYIYGFFSLTLFGSLSFVLPIITDQKRKSNSSVYFNLFLLNAAAIIFVYDKYLDVEKRRESLILDLMGPFFWGLAGFLFIMYVFDLMYKSGVSATLIALLVALSMFGFFVVDTLMNNLFEQWILRRHFHFMFIGTLLITIISVGARLLVMQYDPSDQQRMKSEGDKLNFEASNLILNAGMITTILGVAGVLTGFTLENFIFAAISGVVLFIGLVMVQVIMIYQMRSTMKMAVTTES